MSRSASSLTSRRPILVAAVGDAWSDRAPLQVTQFEADIRLADQVRSLWVEGNGGGNGGESYSAAQLFEALKTETDAAAEGRKGFLFTVGDEPNHDGMTAAQVERVLGVKVERDLSAAECVAMAERHWHVFHIALVNEGYCQHGRNEVLENWRRIMPERVEKESSQFCLRIITLKGPAGGQETVAVGALARDIALAHQHDSDDRHRSARSKARRSTSHRSAGSSTTFGYQTPTGFALHLTTAFARPAARDESSARRAIAQPTP